MRSEEGKFTMSAERKIWSMPTLGEVSVRDALTGSSDQPTVISAGPSIGPNGAAETSYGPLQAPLNGPAGGPPPAPPFGPPVPAPAFSGPPIPSSDVRLKEHIRQTGTTVHGLPLYAFSYRGQTGTYEGVMAQDVLAVRPDAVVVGDDGFYRVDYTKLGIAFRRLH
jgi:hypothetical protein